MADGDTEMADSDTEMADSDTEMADSDKHNVDFTGWSSWKYIELYKYYKQEMEVNPAGQFLDARIKYHTTTICSRQSISSCCGRNKHSDPQNKKTQEQEEENENVTTFFKKIGEHLTRILSEEAYNIYLDADINTIKNTVDQMDVLIMTVLLNRRDYATVVLKKSEHSIYAALLASAIFKSSSKLADAEENIELGKSFKDNSGYFEDLACNVLAEMNCQDSKKSQQLLSQQVEKTKQTVMTIAANNGLIQFMGTTACQTKLNSNWKENMSIFTSKEMIITCVFLPFLIPCIKFVSDKNKTLSNFLTIRWFSCSDLHNGDISLPYAVYCFYHAPVTKFWTHMIAYFVMLCCFSFFVLTDLHPFTYDNLSSMEIIIFFWIFTIFIEEIRQLLKREPSSPWYKIRSWWKNHWNRFDAIMYSLYLLSIVLRLSLPEETFLWARMAYSVTLAVFILRGLHFFYEAKYTGPKIIMIGKMVTDIQFFMMIFVVVLASFGIITQANLFPNSEPKWQLLKDVVYLPYWQMYGELFLETIEGQEHSTCTTEAAIYRNGTLPRCPESNALVPLVLAVYMVFTNILLINLLIAMFSDTFQKVQANSVLIWKFYRYSLVDEYYERPVLVPPLIIVNHLFWILQFIAYKIRTSCNHSENSDKASQEGKKNEFADLEGHVMNEWLIDTTRHEITRSRSCCVISNNETDTDHLLIEIAAMCKKMERMVTEIQNKNR